ncbi:MAG: hypothetical protein Q9194_005993, partial [Teloschistes cf. exilis]
MSSPHIKAHTWSPTVSTSTSTLHNCLVLPVIASAFSKRQLDNASLLIAVDYGLDLSDSLFASNMRVNIQQCLTDYCSEQAGCGATISHGLSGDQCYNDTNICHSVYAPVIDDIAGVGVSHEMFGITQPLVAWAFLRLFDFWLYYALLVFFLLVDRNQAYERAERIKRTNLRYRIPNLISALIEFQKAQCFFMIAVQIAAIIIARKGGFGAQTLQQLSNSYSAITLLAICGYLLVVVTLVNLHGAGKSSWYLMVLSTITVVVSGVTLFTTRKFNPAAGDVAHLYNVTGHWASCGFHDPTTWCLDRQKVDPFSYPGGTEQTFIFCLIVLAFLFLDELRTLPLIRKRLWGSGGRSSSTTKSHRQQTLTQGPTLSRLSS